jgi:hypothetical protein
VQGDDYIYSRKADFASPVIVESHKLVFFLVLGAGEATWKQLFRRLMGYPDWQRDPAELEEDGLRYLHHYNLSQATYFMTNYTIATMVRDPKERLLSAFFKLSRKSDYVNEHCCQFHSAGFKQCRLRNKFLSGFLDQINVCDSPYWQPQGCRMDPRYYSLLDFVGHFETARQDAKTVLKQIGAWGMYGKGWGSKGDEYIFGETNVELIQALETKQTIQASYKNKEKARIEQFFSWDYDNAYLDLKRRTLE